MRNIFAVLKILYKYYTIDCMQPYKNVYNKKVTINKQTLDNLNVACVENHKKIKCIHTYI